MTSIIALLVLAVIFSILVAVVVIVVLAAGKRREAARVPPPPVLPPSPYGDPREILRARFAAGEIDEDEYLRRMSALAQDW
ncbi:SHOCT domain-containing protein [Microbispora sp. NPDC049125]|uniref:SHOCT domain-containing protein n=1 Tax=Microbispora sp. NPDC049125 TaxID=3154929 RepID=UPI0034678A7D